MLLKIVWLSFFALILLGLTLFGGMGVSVSPVLVEKQIPDTQLPQ